jgi:uncharacterized protein
MEMFDPTAMIIIAITFALAGTVKGVIGLGLPTVSLALLTLAFDLTTAMALLLIPSFMTNLWQGAVGGNSRLIWSRLWLFFLIATATIWIGSRALAHVDHVKLSAVLGLSLIAYAAIALAGVRLSVPAAHERWIGPLAASFNGILAGMTGSFVVPGVMFMQAIGLPRDALIQAMGVLFTLSTLGLAIALGGHGLLNAELGIASAAGLVPAIGGMVVGQKVRARLSDSAFRKTFFSATLVLGAYIGLRAASQF